MLQWQFKHSNVFIVKGKQRVNLSWQKVSYVNSCRPAALGYLVHGLGFKMVQLTSNLSHNMVSVTPVGQPVQHLWKTMGLLHLLLTRVPLLILERRVDSCLVWFSLCRCTKTTLTACMCLFGAMILAKDLVSSCHYLEVTILPQQISGVHLVSFSLFVYLSGIHTSVW